MKKSGVGMHVNVDITIFDPSEHEIIEMFSRDWYITSSKSFKIAHSEYRSILIKPSSKIKEMFNLTKELVVAFSTYGEFEPRSIDAIDYLDYQELRLEEICSVIISKDKDIERKIDDILRKNNEERVIIPFSYYELIKNKEDSNFIINKFREKFYQRNLFDIQGPLKREIYFFGRRDLIHRLVNRHLTGSNSGIFGLRKTGKTSILFGIQRVLKKKGGPSIYIDCEVLHLKKWNFALYFIISLLREKYGAKKRVVSTKEQYSKEGEVAELFHKDIKTINRHIGKSILIIFDEVENITFDTSISQKWKTGEYFIKFWQVLRSSNQRSKNTFTYLICGTNPRCLEVPSIGGVDNPIYVQIPPEYIPQFDPGQTMEMVNKLGGFMGLAFDEIICSKLVEDFGGHPFLIRQICSLIHNKITEPRPFKVSKVVYEAIRPSFENGQGKIYTAMILEVLGKFYPDEFYMLELLAMGDIESFKGLAEKSSEYTSHLINYGIIESGYNTFGFKTNLVKTYLAEKNKYQKLNQTNEEKQTEISSRRNKLEPKLRKMVRNQLKMLYGEHDARLTVLNKWGKSTNKRTKFDRLNYQDLFDPNKHEIYLNDLFELMRKNWSKCFSNFFDVDVDLFSANAKYINHYRKSDSHAATISDSDMKSFRGAMEWFESKMDEY